MICWLSFSLGFLLAITITRSYSLLFLGYCVIPLSLTRSIISNQCCDDPIYSLSFYYSFELVLKVFFLSFFFFAWNTICFLYGIKEKICILYMVIESMIFFSREYISFQIKRKKCTMNFVLWITLYLNFIVYFHFYCQSKFSSC